MDAPSLCLSLCEAGEDHTERAVRNTALPEYRLSSAASIVDELQMLFGNKRQPAGQAVKNV
jgi:hypothetical protein